jgi:N-acetylneuraminate synthase
MGRQDRVASFRIGGRTIAGDAPCFFIAEAGVNHNGERARALALVDIAAACGADAVKFQTFSTERLVTRDAPTAGYQRANTGSDESQFAMLRKLELSADDHRALMARCAERGILFLSTPFDEESADLLAELGVVAFKTPSGELTNAPYLRHLAAYGKPMIVSTGMATLGEVEAAVDAIDAAGAPPFALLHCVSDYPAAPETVNLRAMETMERAFGVPTGYSDHTLGTAVAFAAVARGACVLEKHFTQDRELPGPDHRASLETDEVRALAAGIATIHAALGDGRKRPTLAEAATAAVARKSVVTKRAVTRGAVLTADDLTAKRPGTGIAIAFRDSVVGRTARTDIAAGTTLTWEMLG